MTIQNNRVEYIDAFRGFGIVLMIMGHVYFNFLFDKWIHIFHMQMFFVISGYFYKQYPLTELIKKRILTLIVPYCVFGVFHIIIDFMLHGFSKHSLYLLLWENTAEGGVPIAGALWFLTSMFIADIFFNVIQHIIKKNSWKISISFICAILGIVLAVYLPHRLPYGCDCAMVGVGFNQLGKLIKERLHFLIELNAYISILLFVVFSVSGMLNGYINIRTGNYGIWLLFFINSFGMTIALWNIARLAYKCRNTNIVLKTIMTWIKGIGNDSIVYLCLNQLCILVSNYIIGSIIPNSGICTRLLVLVMTLLLLYVWQKIIMNTPLRYIIGRK